jgi:ACR3 family arsenite efflux pump ArsB
LKEVQQASEERETAGEPLPAPGGIGMAVAIDWGLAVQILLTPIIAVFSQSNQMNIFGLNSALSTVLFFVAAGISACVCVFFGEMLRRGHNWARWIQIAVNTLLSLVGIASLLNVYQSIKGGQFWPLITEVILVIISPLIVWRLSRSSTARWFQAVTVAEASKRHGGRWVWFIALWAIVGGVLQTIAAHMSK